MKKRAILLLSLILVFIVLLAGAFYFFYRGKPFPFGQVRLDKYSETFNWCGGAASDQNLNVECSALLVDIRMDDENRSCFDVQILAEDSTNDYTFCEQYDSISYTNEILQYKKLMPIQLSLSYSKNSLFNNYTFNKVDIYPMTDEVFQSFVNNDIAELVGIDMSSTTIKNSVDFCPRPEMLPEYITEENTTAYKEFYETNKMEYSEYEDGYNYSLDNIDLRLLFGCDSKYITGYTTSSCLPATYNLSSEGYTALGKKPNTPTFGTELNENDRYFIKIATLLYDGVDYIKFEDSSAPLDLALDAMNSGLNVNEYTYCAVYKTLSAQKDMRAKEYSDKILQNISNNITILTSPFCAEMISDSLANKKGLYLRITNSFTPNDFSILKKCKMLNSVLENN